MILKRDPALWAALARVLIICVSTFLFTLSDSLQIALNATVAAALGLIVAWQVALERVVPAILGFIEAGVSLALALGWDASPERQALVLTLVATVVAVITRDRVVATVDELGRTRTRVDTPERAPKHARPE